MISASIQAAMNEQIGNEFFSALAYLSMSAYCEAEDLPGASAWLRAQYQEELTHAMKFVDFIQDRDGRVSISATDRPPEEFASLVSVFETALAQERAVTAQINAIYAAAVAEDDYASQAFLDWFVTEQVEEEKSVSDVVERLKLAGDNSAAILIVDSELGGRSG
ncbi:MAG: ferritin [Dehalococcoidia bacterium]